MRKILIANRGEIACRIIRTAVRMGLETVAVYSDADSGLPHVQMADQALCIGPPPASESYLSIEKLIEAARHTGADAIHPGYGFLSENAMFAQACAAQGITFVGPTPEAIRAMGLKDAAKRAMKAAGVPVLPGYQGDDQSLHRLERAAKSMGYPVLIKAVAGGGGKGMRLVEDEAAFGDALNSAKREADRAFGNDSVLIEKYLPRARHIEVQIFADGAGNTVHLFERDCSLQRRHQKVVEEAPAPRLPESLRTAMGIAAVKAARAIGYVGAGTIEFIVDVSNGLVWDAASDAPDAAHGSAPFYFMEMNTRLQVEHPVTEMITGLDLVEWQIRVARGELLPLSQADIAMTGHAVEARLYAEDTSAGFLPSTGILSQLKLPEPSTRLRVDTGVIQGNDVTIHYDPMIAKIIAFGQDRSTAIDRLVGALDACIVGGVETNRAFLTRLLSLPDFRSGDYDTGLIASQLPALGPPADMPDRLKAVAALALATRPKEARSAGDPWTALGPWRVSGPGVQHLELYLPDGSPVHLRVLQDMSDYSRADRRQPLVTIEGLEKTWTGHGQWSGPHQFTADLDGDLVRTTVLVSDKQVELRAHGQTFLLLRQARQASAADVFDGSLRAPMPGKVLAVSVRVGQRVAAGERLAMLEAMKMEHMLSAPADARVTAVHVRDGDQVERHAVLIELTLAP